VNCPLAPAHIPPGQKNRPLGCPWLFFSRENRPLGRLVKLAGNPFVIGVNGTHTVHMQFV
jgi:hypothetical protein